MYSFVLLFFSNLFSSDMIIILIVALFLFGGEKLPEIARGLGKGIRDFKDASESVKREINNQINSYEEKKVEEGLNKQAAEIQNQLPGNAETLAENRPPVENTMPVNENQFNGNETTITGGDTGEYSDPANDQHATVQHTDAGTESHEPIKKL
jgi:sec-independent protein translocase protein TatA